MTGCCDCSQVLDACHNMACADIRNARTIVFSIVKERVALEVYPRLVDTTGRDCVANPLTDHDCDHDRQNVSERSGKFKHDNHDRYSHSCRSGKR